MSNRVPKQKFFRGHRVKIAEKLPNYMSHFSGAGCEAIVEYSYSDIYRGNNVKDYGLCILEKGKLFYLSWYQENLLTLINDNRDEGEKILQSYKEANYE